MKDKKPFLIDKRLANLFLDESISVFINPKEINYINVEKVKLKLKTEEDGVEEKENEFTEAYEIKIFTKNSTRDRFVFYSEKPKFDWLKDNAERCGLSLFFRNENNECIYINKDNIIDMRFERKMEQVNEEGKEPKLIQHGELHIFFTCPQTAQYKTEHPEEHDSNDFLALTTRISIDEEMLKWNDYDIVFEYLNKF